MKIEEVINEMWRTPIEVVGESEMTSWIKTIEQHHKDLMGLVESWRECAAVTMYEDRAIDFRQCADDLESLINPKD